MNNLHRRAFRGILCVVLAAVAGCSGRDSSLPQLVPVEGIVTLDDAPLSSAMITFFPVGETRGRGAVGYTNDQGHYKLEAPDGRPGVPVGEYRVTIIKLEMPDGSDFPANSDVAPMDSPARQILDDQYSDDRHTILAETVPEGGAKINFELKSSPGNNDE